MGYTQRSVYFRTEGLKKAKQQAKLNKMSLSKYLNYLVNKDYENQNQKQNSKKSN